MKCIAGHLGASYLANIAHFAQLAKYVSPKFCRERDSRVFEAPATSADLDSRELIR
jgi:hypothetical protein